MDDLKAISKMSMRQETTPDHCTIFLEGQFDTISAAKLGDDLLAILDSPSTVFIIDAEKLTYLTSAGIRIILMMLKKAKASKKTLQLKTLQPMIRDVMEMTGMLRLFEII